jgi:hypothetical protein
MKYMICINLHETEFLEETLEALAKVSVKDSVVYTVDGIASHHGRGPIEPFVFGSISRLFTKDRNINKFILAVIDEEKIQEVTEELKLLNKQDRWAASFWFVPIQGYFYHKRPAPE